MEIQFVHTVIQCQFGQGNLDAATSVNDRVEDIQETLAIVQTEMNLEAMDCGCTLIGDLHYRINRLLTCLFAWINDCNDCQVLSTGRLNV